MRHLPLGVLAGALVIACITSISPLAAQAPSQRPAASPGAAAVERASQVLAATRAALGAQKLAAVATITATGQTRRVRGNNLVPIEFAISIQRPDKYVRKDEVPAEESAPTSTGFAGDELIQVPPAPPAQRDARLLATRQEFTRLALGLWADSIPQYPLTFAYVGQAAAPQGMADVLNVTAAGGFAARLFIDGSTHLPLMLTWQAPAGGRGAAATPVENRLYYADYRDVDGLRLPFRLRRAVGADTTEETTFDRFRLNARIDPKTFDAK